MNPLWVSRAGRPTTAPHTATLQRRVARLLAWRWCQVTALGAQQCTQRPKGQVAQHPLPTPVLWSRKSFVSSTPSHPCTVVTSSTLQRKHPVTLSWRTLVAMRTTEQLWGLLAVCIMKRTVPHRRRYLLNRSSKYCKRQEKNQMFILKLGTIDRTRVKRWAISEGWSVVFTFSWMAKTSRVTLVDSSFHLIWHFFTDLTTG